MKDQINKRKSSQDYEDLELYIDTSQAAEIIIGLLLNGDFLVRKKISAPRRQSEKLLPAIDKLFFSRDLSLHDLKRVIVVNRGDSFTSLRIGVLTANALAYALRIPVVDASWIEKAGQNKQSHKNLGLKSFSGQSIVEPVYNREANIGVTKSV